MAPTTAQVSPQALLAASAPPQGGSLGFEDVARLPRPGSQGVASAAFSPDGAWLTYLASADGASLSTELYATRVATGETRLAFGAEGGVAEGAKLSKEEQMRRERARVMATGVTSYAWAKGADVLLVPSGGALFVKRGVEGEAVRLFDPGAHGAVGAGPPLDARVSDDGAVVAFVWDDEVCVVDAAGGGAPRRVTEGARGVEGVTHGVADYCAMEEMDRYAGFWLNPSGSRVCFERVDETRVGLVQIPRPGDAEDPGACEAHRYPFAGEENPTVKLGVARAAGGGAPPVWLDLQAAGLGEDVYLARVAWRDDRTVVATVQSRDQRTCRVRGGKRVANVKPLLVRSVSTRFG